MLKFFPKIFLVAYLFFISFAVFPEEPVKFILISREENAWLENRLPFFNRCSEAGIHNIWFQWRVPVEEWNENGVKQYLDKLDNYVNEILKNNPERKIFFQVLTTVRSGTNWTRKYPRQLEIWPPQMTEGDRVSSFSETYLKSMERSISIFGKHVVESSYANSVSGMVICGGGGEWFSYYDFSEHALKAYKTHLSEKHGDIQSLNRSWKSNYTAFEDIKFPSWAEVSGEKESGFYDPETERKMIDYFEFHHNGLARIVSFFAKTLKEATNSKYPVGMWGKGLSPVASYNNFFRRGKDRNPSAELQDDSSIDLFAFPYSYESRHAGGLFFSQYLSPILRGKRQICEDDTRTPQTNSIESFKTWEKWGDNFGQAKTNKAAAEILKRNFAGMITAGGYGGISFYSMGKGLWFDVPEIISTFRTIAECAKEAKGEPDSGIAVVYSRETRNYQSCNSYNFSNQSRCALEIARVGAPVSFCEIRDMIRNNFPFDKYKMYIFVDCFYLTSEQREVINARIKNKNKIVLWFYASGYITQNALSKDALSEITGIKIDTFGKKLYLENETDMLLTASGHWLTKHLPPCMRIVEPRPMAPVFWADDASAEMIGEGLNTDSHLTFRKPLLAVKKYPGWTSIWCGISYLPSVMIRNIAEKAGVHIYTDSGDQVFAGAGFIGIHAAYDGTRKIKLPCNMTLFDPFSQKIIVQNSDTVEIFMKQGYTALWIKR